MQTQRRRRRTTGRRPAVQRRAPARHAQAPALNLNFGSVFGALGGLLHQGFAELAAISSGQAQEIAGVLLALAGTLGLVSLFPSQWPMLQAMSALVRGLFGVGSALVLVGMVYTGATMLLSRIWSRITSPGTWEVLCWAGVLANLLGLVSLLSMYAGGLVGRILGQGGYHYIGPWVILPLLAFLVFFSVLALRMSAGQSLLAGIGRMRNLNGQRQRLSGFGRRAAELGARLTPILARLRREAEAPTETPREEAPPPPPDPDPDPQPAAAEDELIVPDRAGGEAAPARSEPEEVEGHVVAAARVVGDWDEMPRIDWLLPSLSLLDAAAARNAARQGEIRETTGTIERTLAMFGVQARVVDVNAGPSFTQYALQPAAGVPVRKVVTLQNDLALALGGVQLRIEAPIPGKAAVGIEVPNKATSTVAIREVAEKPIFLRSGFRLGVVLGQDVTGAPICGDLMRMPHLLIGGATGQGKSVCIHDLLVSLLMMLTPDELRVILIDPKRVELSHYRDLPHLACPVVREAYQAAGALKWAVGEMERRYKLLEELDVQEIDAYNERARARGARELPRLMIVIDELADLMMVAAGEVEESICRLTQLGRAAGIHLVVATQRPDSAIVTGLIKANIPSRIAFAVGSQVDSRVILDKPGAEKLLGRGDMLYLPVDQSTPRRLQGAFVSLPEVDRVVAHWRPQGDPVYLGVLDGIRPPTAEGGDADDRALDPLFARAARAVATEGTASVSLIQRKFNCGYSRAGRIVDQLAAHKVIGGWQGSKARVVLMTLSDVDELLEQLGLEG